MVPLLAAINLSPRQRRPSPNQQRADAVRMLPNSRKANAATFAILESPASLPCQVSDPGWEQVRALLLEPVPVGTRQLVAEFVGAPVRAPQQARWAQQAEAA